MFKNFLFICLLLLPTLGFSQNQQRTATAIQNQSSYAKLVPNAQITVCVYNSQLQCNTPVTIYSDSALTQAITYPFFADPNGNYNYYAPAGTYVEQMCAPINQCYTYQITLISGQGASTAPIFGHGPPTLPCPTGNLGQLYTNIDNNLVYSCGTAGWASTSSGAGGSNLQVQFNNSGALGGSGGVQVDSTGVRLITKLPKVDVTQSSFGADPTDGADSSAAISSAITYAVTHPVEGQSTPCVYLPGGIYKVNSTIVWPSGTPICIMGDNRQATVIDASGIGANNVFTFKGTGAPGGSVKMFGGGLISDIQISGADLVNTGSAIEFNNTDDVDVVRVACTNWAGRCFNLYGDSERNVFYHLTANSSNIAVDTGFQANENNFLDAHVLFPGQTNNTNLCYHTGINCDPTTHLYPAANLGICSNYPAWGASTVYAKGSVICDSNNNIEVATSYGTSNTTVPTWATGSHAFTCDGSSGDCGASTIPYGKTDWSGPEQWENVTNSTLVPPDPTPAVFLSGNKNNWNGGSIKSLLATSAIVSIGVTNTVQNVYCEAGPFGGRPGNSFCVWAGDVDTGVTSSFTTSSLTTTATTIPVISAMYFYGGHLGTDADAAVGNSPIGFSIACPDYDPTSSASCTTSGFTSFLKNQRESVNINAFSNQNNGFVHSAGRCTTGSSPAICTVGSGVGAAWPSGAIVMLNQSGASPVNVRTIHSTSTNGRGTGYFSLSSETLNYTLADGRKISLAQGDFGVGPRPDGRAFTNIDSVQGFGGTQSGQLLLEDFTPTTGTDQYNNQAGIVIPINGSDIIRDNDPGTNAVLPNGIIIGSYDSYVRPTVQIAVHGANFTRGVSVRESLGQIWAFGTNGTQQYTRQIRSGTFGNMASGLDMLGGWQFANQYCVTDTPDLNNTGTQPNMRTCDEGGPGNTVNARWHFDINMASGWTPIGTLDANGYHQSGNSIPGIGESANFVQNSLTLSSGAWSASGGAPTITITAGQADPYGGTGASLVAVGASSGNFEYFNTASSTFTAGQTLTACTWLKGAAGGEQVLFDANINGNVAPFFQAGGATGLTTGWVRYSGTGVGSGTTRPFRWGEGGVQPAESFYIYNPQTQPGTVCGPDLFTTTSVFQTVSVLSADNGLFNSLADINLSTGAANQVATASGTGSWHWANSGVSGLTTGKIPVATSATTLGNSHIDDGLTTPSIVTILEGLVVNPGGPVNSIQVATNLFSALPTCNGGNEGTLAPVTDSTTNTWGATITGSGADHVLAYCDSSAWTVAAK